MTKSELTKQMEAFVGGGFITRDELTKFMGYKSCTSTDKYLVGLPNITKRYFIPDVAERLLENRKYR